MIAVSRFLSSCKTSPWVATRPVRPRSLLTLSCSQKNERQGLQTANAARQEQPSASRNLNSCCLKQCWVELSWVELALLRTSSTLLHFS